MKTIEITIEFIKRMLFLGSCQRGTTGGQANG